MDVKIDADGTYYISLGAVNTGILGTVDGQVLRYNGTGAVWVSLDNTAETVKLEQHPCSFCAATTSIPATKQGWHLCSSPICTRAAEAQAERMYAGLFDSPETRAAALTWVKTRG